MKNLCTVTILTVLLLSMFIPMSQALAQTNKDWRLPEDVRLALSDALADPPINEEFLVQFYRDGQVQTWVNSGATLRVPLQDSQEKPVQSDNGRITYSFKDISVEFQKQGIFFCCKSNSWKMQLLPETKEVECVDSVDYRDFCKAIYGAMRATSQKMFYENVKKALATATRPKLVKK